jgi:hypothetical protein
MNAYIALTGCNTDKQEVMTISRTVLTYADTFSRGGIYKRTQIFLLSRRKFLCLTFSSMVFVIEWMVIHCEHVTNWSTWVTSSAHWHSSLRLPAGQQVQLTTRLLYAWLSPSQIQQVGFRLNEQHIYYWATDWSKPAWTLAIKTSGT